MRLYTYFRSSAAYRVRIALNLKGLDYEAIPVHLLKSGGEQLQPSYRAVNPAALVPALDDDGAIVTQSLAIIEYLDEKHAPAMLLPADAASRARVRALAQMVACDIHPLCNLRVLRYLVHTMKVSEDVKLDWIQHWLRIGLASLEALLVNDARTGRFCHGDMPSIADCCLVPQVFNALRFELDMTPYPAIMRIQDACAGLPQFIAAHPAQQPDAE